MLTCKHATTIYPYKMVYLCLQQTWDLDDNIHYFTKIHTTYLFTAISGVNSKDHTLQGRHTGRVVILYIYIIGNKVKLVLFKYNNLWNNENFYILSVVCFCLYIYHVIRTVLIM